MDLYQKDFQVLGGYLTQNGEVQERSPAPGWPTSERCVALGQHTTDSVSRSI